jgi:tRNA nucleotidyltransferase (CCA-adding enzyme)
MPWQHFQHQADIGVRGIGHTKNEAFEQAALALTYVVTDAAMVAPLEESSFHCEAPDDELLLAEWLNVLIYEMATTHRLFSRFQVTLLDGSLDGRAWGEPVDVGRHQPAVEIKGATYTALSVRQVPEGWIADCVVDV